MSEPANNRPEYFGNRRPQMMPFVPQDVACLLDVGCGAGEFSSGLQAARPGRNLETWGVELDPVAAAIAGTKLDRVLTGPLDSFGPFLPQQYFDCVVMNDVIEHVAQPEQMLTQVHGLLKPGGCVVASIPNVRYFFNVMDLAWNGRWDYTDEGILDRTHLRFFTRGSMIKLMEDNGFQVERAQGINPTGSLKFKLANMISLGRFADMRFLQFAVVARRRN